METDGQTLDSLPEEGGYGTSPCSTVGTKGNPVTLAIKLIARRAIPSPLNPLNFFPPLSTQPFYTIRRRQAATTLARKTGAPFFFNPIPTL